MDIRGKASDDRRPVPVSCDDLLAKGKQCEQDGFYPEALAFYQSALDSGVVEARLHYRLGCTALKMDRITQAEQAFRAAVDLEPQNPRFLTNLGVALDRLGRRDDAIRCYKRSSLHGDGTVVAHHNLGAIYAEEGRIEEAVRSFKAALALEPDTEGYHNLGRVYYRSGCFLEALDCFRQAVRCDAGFALGHYYEGLCLMKAGNYAEALLRFQRARDLDSSLARIYFHLGCCFHKLERFKDARVQLERALEAFPEDTRVHYQLALTFDALGLHPQARVHYGLASSCRSRSSGNP